MTEQNASPPTAPTPRPAGEPMPAGAGQAANWAQPPAAGAGWAQPPGTDAARLLFGSTEAKQWVANPALAERAEAAAAVLTTKGARTPAPPVPSYRPVRTFTPTVQSCPRCGGNIDFDGYCEQCGAKAPSIREHFEQAPAEWVAGVCDRGIRHLSNEDAMALEATAEPGSQAVLVVCDGVSMSAESDRASLAAARATVQFLVSRPDWEWNLLDLAPDSATTLVLTEAAGVANQTVLENSDLTDESPASATLAIGVVHRDQVLAATLGDSRVYWLPDSGAATLLSTDHSMAQEEIALGVDRAVAESGTNSHVITRWLGRDAPDTTPAISSTRIEGPGWFMVCSDGLWNYASDPAAMSQLVQQTTARAGAEPIAVARQLVSWANEQGGHDNITVALARLVPAQEPVAAPVTEVPEPDQIDLPTTRTRPVPPADQRISG